MVLHRYEQTLRHIDALPSLKIKQLEQKHQLDNTVVPALAPVTAGAHVLNIGSELFALDFVKSLYRACIMWGGPPMGLCD